MLAFASMFVASLAASVVAAGPHGMARRHHVVPNGLEVAQNNTVFKRQDNARLTMYYQTGNAGACGGYNKNSDFIVALNYQQYESGDWCGKMIEISVNGKTAQAQIVDECPGDCPWGAVDCSPALASYLGFYDGQAYGSWNLVGSNPTTTSSAPPKTTSTHTTPKSTSTPSPPPTTTSTKPHTTSHSTSPTTLSSSNSIPSSSSSSSSAALSSESTAPASSPAASATPVPTSTGNIDLLSTNLVDMALLVAAALQAE